MQAELELEPHVATPSHFVTGGIAKEINDEYDLSPKKTVILFFPRVIHHVACVC
jgi:hypothetical protein